MAAVKAQYGPPQDTWSCHTAVIAGYAVEGHVPVEAIEDLLAERPAIMGSHSPGCRPARPACLASRKSPFEVLAVKDGVASPFGSY